MIEWYQRVFEAEVVYQNPVFAFLTYDDEHHRFAFANLSALSNRSDQHVFKSHRLKCSQHTDDFVPVHSARIACQRGGGHEQKVVHEQFSLFMHSLGHALLTTREIQLWRSGAIGIGTLYVCAPTPTPPSQVFGGVVQTRRVEGHSAAQNI